MLVCTPHSTLLTKVILYVCISLGTLPKALRKLTKLNVLYLNHNEKLIKKEKTIKNMLPKVQWVNI